MLENTYDILWNNCVSPAANELFSFYNDDYRKKYNWRFDSSDELRRQVYQEYCNNRNLIHEDFFRGKKYDLHKIGACFARAIIEICPLKFDMCEDLPEIVVLSNYWLAVSSSIYIVRFILLHDYLKVDNALAEKLQTNSRFSFPRTTPGHYLYLRGKVRALAVNDGNNISFDFLGYADMLFWLEYYNRQLLENKLEPMVLRNLQLKSVE
ncbi:MAG: hypothetical protein IJ733_14115 [Lachnospiraceae bacterium]|nr:hypothetical protein [Lachnospiraceae bacterium]